MSEKMECPGCGGYSSTILRHFSDGEPCPFCGLSADAAIEILAVRKTRSDKALTERLAETIKERDKAQTALERLRRLFIDVEGAVEQFRDGEGS